MFRSQMKQICRKCNGTGVTDKVLTDKDDNVLLAPPYQKGEGDKPQFVPCKECVGSGWAMYDAPSEIMVEGEKVALDEPARRARFQDALA